MQPSRTRIRPKSFLSCFGFFSFFFAFGKNENRDSEQPSCTLSQALTCITSPPPKFLWKVTVSSRAALFFRHLLQGLFPPLVSLTRILCAAEPHSDPVQDLSFLTWLFLFFSLGKKRDGEQPSCTLSQAMTCITFPPLNCYVEL